MPPGTTRLGGSGAVGAGSAAGLRPAAPDLVADATTAAVSAAAAAVDLTCLELEVVAVGMGLRFVEIETHKKVRAHAACSVSYALVRAGSRHSQAPAADRPRKNTRAKRKHSSESAS